MTGIKINFIKLLAAKSEELNIQQPSLNEVANITNIDRRKLYSLRDMSLSDSVVSDDKFPLNFGEAMALCDYLGCKMGELVEYTPNPPLASGQQVRDLRQSPALETASA